MSDDGKIKLSFETKAIMLLITNLVPLKVLRAGVKDSRKYAQILGSVRAIGLVEAPAVSPDPDHPDFTPAQLQPMDARWVVGYGRWGTVSPYDIFRGWTAECGKLFPDHPQHLRIAASGATFETFLGSREHLNDRARWSRSHRGHERH